MAWSSWHQADGVRGRGPGWSPGQASRWAPSQASREVQAFPWGRGIGRLEESAANLDPHLHRSTPRSPLFSPRSDHHPWRHHTFSRHSGGRLEGLVAAEHWISPCPCPSSVLWGGPTESRPCSLTLFAHAGCLQAAPAPLVTPMPSWPFTPVASPSAALPGSISHPGPRPLLSPGQPQNHPSDGPVSIIKRQVLRSVQSQRDLLQTSLPMLKSC